MHDTRFEGLGGALERATRKFRNAMSRRGSTHRASAEAAYGRTTTGRRRAAFADTIGPAPQAAPGEWGASPPWAWVKGRRLLTLARAPARSPSGTLSAKSGPRGRNQDRLLHPRSPLILYTVCRVRPVSLAIRAMPTACCPSISRRLRAWSH